MDANISSKKLEGEISSAGVIEGGVVTRYGVSYANGITPLLKIENEYWHVSYDEGITWTSLDVKATGERGRDGVGGKDGNDGKTPYIQNSDWWINGENTGVRAEGVDGEDGEDGTTPHIGENGNWFIGETDTNVRARGGTDAHIFNSQTELTAWLSIEGNKETLNAGDDIIIKEEGVPDYWWDGEELQINETDLSGYSTKDHDHDEYVQVMSKVDEAKKEATPIEDRPFSPALFNPLIQETNRVYVEKAANGGVLPYFYIDSNAFARFDPRGYTSLLALREANGLTGFDVVEGTHYTKVERKDADGNVLYEKDADGNVIYEGGKKKPLYNYHVRLGSIPVRTADGNLRTGVPRDSSDAVNFGTLQEKLRYSYVDLNFTIGKTSIPLRDAKGEMRCHVTDEFTQDGYGVKTFKYSSQACVNKGYVDTKFATKDALTFTTEEDRVQSNFEVGGISANEDISGLTTNEVLKRMLTSYKAFAVLQPVLNLASYTFEYGTSVTVERVTPRFTAGSNAITSIKIGTTEGAGDLYTGTSATSGTAITLTNKKTYDCDTYKSNPTQQIWVTLSDGKTTKSKSVSINFVKHNYVAVTNSTDIPTVGDGFGYARSFGTSHLESIEADGKYIWFLIPEDDHYVENDSTTIEYLSDDGYTALPTEKIKVEEFVTSTGQKFSYYAYRAEKMKTSTKESYCLCTTPCYPDGSEPDDGGNTGGSTGGGTVTATDNYVFTTTNKTSPKSASTSATITSVINIGSSTIIENFENRDGEYVWFLTPSNAYTTIWYQEAGIWDDMVTTKAEEVKNFNDTGITYYAYRTYKSLTAYTSTYEIR